jgi:hypothetical protein
LPPAAATPASAAEQWPVAVGEQGRWLIGVRRRRRPAEEGDSKLAKAKEGATGEIGGASVGRSSRGTRSCVRFLALIRAGGGQVGERGVNAVYEPATSLAVGCGR